MGSVQDPPVSSVTSIDGASSSVSGRSRILLIKPSSLGDIVHTLPVVSAIKAQWPGSHITWLVKRQWADLVERVEGVDRVWPVDPTVWSWVKQGQALRAEGFDLAIDLQGLFRSAVLARLSGAPMRIGFANGREGSPWFYTHRVPVLNPDVHAVDRYLLVAAALGIVVPKRPRFAFRILDEDLAVVRRLFERNNFSIDRPWVAINVGARWPTKRWPLTSFSAVADLLYETHRDPVVLIGSSDDRPSVERLRDLMKRPCIDLSGQVPLRCLPALLSKAAVMITNDSGPMHIAAACGIPVVALFGPTSATRTGPYGTSHHVLTGRVSCSPCFSRVCHHDPEMECLKRITPAHVTDVVQPLLAAHGTCR
ncbi:MAG: lipopolysaccharide heptosyltransferase II [Nitrospira sp.]|nr:lipopolysaccharide heptosyltransferase II [Nitrospira sp.]MDH4242186.1 lipopolysaccharide heptosyltransferase II [Nitrospira sp.]MDH4357036.1 lipopolysaccharide heptosyltransferase II [Nitrospira sp.]MDH5317582.1 lipopolysaccharide heptosyltransferase II [Nitrospira sp.]